MKHKVISVTGNDVRNTKKVIHAKKYIEEPEES